MSDGRLSIHASTLLPALGLACAAAAFGAAISGGLTALHYEQQVQAAGGELSSVKVRLRLLESVLRRQTASTSFLTGDATIPAPPTAAPSAAPTAAMPIPPGEAPTDSLPPAALVQAQTQTQTSTPSNGQREVWLPSPRVKAVVVGQHEPLEGRRGRVRARQPEPAEAPAKAAPSTAPAARDTAGEAAAAAAVPRALPPVGQPSQANPPIAVTPEMVAHARKSTRMEVIAAAKLGILRLGKNEVVLKNGGIVHIGEAFPSGEHLLAVDQADAQILTTTRNILVL